MLHQHYFKQDVYNKEVIFCHCGEIKNLKPNKIELCDKCGKPLWENKCIACRTEELLINKMYNELPEYIEEFYPKGEVKDRGEATVKITKFILNFAREKGVIIS